MAQSILVTGGAGFIGSHLVRWLVTQGHAVRVIDNLKSGRLETLDAVHDDIEVIVGDIRDSDVLEQAVDGVDLIFHLAAVVSVIESVTNPTLTYDVNLQGSLGLFEAARRAQVRRVVQASTCAVYGHAARTPQTEDLLPMPLSPYAASKLAAEQAGQLYTQLYQLEVAALRFFNVYGPGQDPDSPYTAAIPLFLSALRQGRAITIYGDGQQTRDFVFIDDIVAALWAAASAPHAVGSVCNVGRAEPYTILQLVELLADRLQVHVEPIFKPERPGEVRHSAASIKRLVELTGFQPHIDLKQGLEKLF